MNKCTLCLNHYISFQQYHQHKVKSGISWWQKTKCGMVSWALLTSTANINLMCTHNIRRLWEIRNVTLLFSWNKYLVWSMTLYKIWYKIWHFPSCYFVYGTLHLSQWKGHIYSWLSLSRPRLSQITAYLEVKIWSRPKHKNLTTGKNILEKRRDCSSFPQYFQYICYFKSSYTYI